MRVQHAAALRAGEVDEVDLRVGLRELRPGADERRGMPGRDRKRAGFEEKVLQADLRAAPPAREIVVQRDVLAAAPEGAGVEMVLQVFAYAGRVVHQRDAVALEQRA